MNYPLISEYIEAIKAAEDNFKELTNLRPVLYDDGQPVMTSGNFAVVFKMEDMDTGKFYALKCFTKEQEGREEAYHQIAEELKNVESPYLISIKYLDKELFVDTDQTADTEFPVLLMDWVEGKTLDKYLRENLDDKYALEMLAYRFSQLAQWIIPQPFAHGDLKPDNILVREDGTLVLVDYDGMYVPAMKGQKARELGSPDYRHPLRTEDDFDEHIDDFSIIVLLLSLKCMSIGIGQYKETDVLDGTLFHESDYKNITNSKAFQAVLGFINIIDIARLYAAFVTILAEKKMDYSFISFLFKGNEQSQAYNEIEQRSLWDEESKFCWSCCLRNGFGCEKDVKRGIDILLQLAREGDGKAQNQLGFCYDYGIGVKQNFKEAVFWYSKAASQGNPFAQLNLGICYLNGEGVDQDDKKAFDCFSKATEQGNAMSDYYLGDCFLNGDGVQRNEDEAFKCYLRAAEKGNPLAQSWLIDCSAYGYEPREYNKVVKWYKETAEHGNALAQYWLGNQLYYGLGMKKDQGEAVKWYLKAANQSYSLALRQLAECYKNGEGVTQNHEKAVEFLFKAAEQGDCFSQFVIGDFYYYGDVVPHNYEKAFGWYMKSAMQGHTEAQYSLGDCYYYGYGVPKKYEEALKWYIKAAEKGNEFAQFKLGACYENGRGVPQSKKEAFDWYMKSAIQGYSDAQYNVGDCYFYGRGVKLCYEKAVEWYIKAAEQMDSDAQNNLGVCYVLGLGVQKNFEKAVEWFMKAAKINSDAMLNMGYLFYKGMGVTKSVEKAGYFYSKANYKNSIDYIFSAPEEDLDSYSNEGTKELDIKAAENYYSSCNGEMQRSSDPKDIFE